MDQQFPQAVREFDLFLEEAKIARDMLFDLLGDEFNQNGWYLGSTFNNETLQFYRYGNHPQADPRPLARRIGEDWTVAFNGSWVGTLNGSNWRVCINDAERPKIAKVNLDMPARTQ